MSNNEPRKFINPPPEMEAEIRNLVAENGGYITGANEWNSEQGAMVNVLTVYLPQPEPMPAPVENQDSPWAHVEELGRRFDAQNKVSVPAIAAQLAERVQAVKNRWPALNMSDEGALWAVVADKDCPATIQNAALREVGL